MARRLLSLIIVLAATIAACPAVQAGEASDRQALFVLDRLAFGPSAEDLASIRRMGVDAWIARQLDPASIAESSDLTARLAGLDTLTLTPAELFQRFGPPQRIKGEAVDPEAVKAARRRAGIVVEQAAAARLWRAVESRRQLQEMMVDFWFNHFNVFAGKGLDHLWVGHYEAAAIRPHALGRFRDLLEATARHPAMLFYLDNWQNTAPGSPGAKGRQTGLNENYARELLELHTLGVDGGYSQDDVTALARILTGWGLVPPRAAAGPVDPGLFAFDPARHDGTDQRLLGRIVAGGGADQVERALDLLAASPATAHHISFELAQYFVADQPPPALVEALTRRWMQTGGDIRAVLATLFASRAFHQAAQAPAKFKTPFQYVVSAVRAAGLPVDNPRPLLGALRRLGQPIYGCQTPDGYKNTREDWLSPDGLTQRISFATALGAGRLPLDRPPPVEATDGATAPAAAAQAQPDMADAQPVQAGRLAGLLGPLLSAKTQAAAAAAPPRLQAAVILGSPDFMAR